ncbi:MAG TPA: alpha/beta hydrolase [Chthoniobacterales bacterium]
MNADVLRRNNVKVFGAGTQPMLFAHGFGCDQNMWRFVTPAFADRYKIVLFDYVGAGKSDVSAYDPRRYGSLEGYAQDVLEICEALDLRDIIFVGHSVSSVIGVLAANRAAERFERLIMVGPSASYINDADYVGGFERKDIEGLLEMMDKNYLGWASFLAPAVMKNANDPALTAELEQSFCATDPKIARRFAEITFLSDNRADFPKLQVPALIMQCTEDMIAPIPVGEWLARQIPHNTFRLMKATGHCPHMSAPAETIAVINDYLNLPVAA